VEASANSAMPNQQDHSPRSVEEVLMNFPYQNKIKLLGRISLPCSETAPMSPVPRTRGAIIALEGDDIAAVKELSQWLHERLSKDTEADYRPRIAEPPKLPHDNDITFEDYLDLIKEWHTKSKEMVKYITTAELSPSASQDTVMSEKDSDKEIVDVNRKDSATPSDTPIPEAASITSTTDCPATKPIIILPTFQLAASVAYAIRIPNQDAYSCIDHWQWMATLWRGMVGPDLTIYVKTHEKGAESSKPEMDDVVRCLTVGKERDGKFTDADLRRVGFEVSEFINGMTG
jgi:hypothetical protein